MSRHSRMRGHFATDAFGEASRLGEYVADGGELFGGDALFEEEIDAGVGKRTAEGEHQLHFGIVQVIAELFKRGFKIVPGNRAKIEIGHRLLGQPLQDIDAHIGANIFDSESGIVGHVVHRSWRCLTGRPQRSTVSIPDPGILHAVGS
jgi:hypothetical protein